MQRYPTSVISVNFNAGSWFKLVFCTSIPCSGCIKQLKIKWEFLQPFAVFRRIFLDAVMDKSAEGGLKSIGNTRTAQKKSSVTQKFPLKILQPAQERKATRGERTKYQK